jgi:hypothetical protein
LAFAWYGIELDLDDEWAPVSIEGDQKQGYARLGSTRAHQVQLRWDTVAKAPSISDSLERYLARIGKDSRKAAFTKEINVASESEASYRYSGRASARGSIRYIPDRNLVVLVECVTPGKDSLSAAHQKISSSLKVDCGDLYHWQVLGLNVYLPKDLEVGKRQLFAGRTTIQFTAGKHTLVTAERWGLASELLAKHDFLEWARAALELPRANITDEDVGIRLVQKGHLLTRTQTALVGLYPKENRIQSVKVQSNRSEWNPEWRWIGFSKDGSEIETS